MLIRFTLLAALLCTVSLHATSAENALRERDRRVSYRVLETLPHDATLFTQGLAMHRGQMLESGGLYGHSALLLRERAHTAPTRQYRLPHSFFAEGVAVCKGEVHLLTWREQLAWVFTPELKLKRRVSYAGEGWGLTCRNGELVRSDGSARLSMLDPKTHRLRRVVEVRDQGHPVAPLNELEYARGWILANVWHRDEVALIEPQHGEVEAWLDLSDLRRALPDGTAAGAEDVLNGLAYDSDSDVLYATGKRWPLLFALRVDWPQRNQETSTPPR